MLPTLCKQRYIGVAEAIDRLHWIADGEKSVVVVCLPPLGQKLKKMQLAVRCVLEFINQQMPNFVVEI